MATPLAAFASYLAAHFLAYLWLRRLAALRTEKGIFLYHLVPALVMSAIALIAALENPAFGLAGLAALLAAQGLYSLSFLELWTLAQGGYSLSIIAEVVRAEAAGTPPDLAGLAAIGEAKQSDRVSALRAMGLVQDASDRIELTPRGRAVAFALHALRRWVDPADGVAER